MSDVLFIDPAKQQFVVPVPKRESEFDVQAQIWSSLRDLGLDVRGEVKTRAKFEGCRKSSVTCRFDLVVYAQGEAVLIIEVKARPVSHKSAFTDTRQGLRYPCFGIPVVVAYGMGSVDEVISHAMTLCGKKRRPSKQEAV